MHTMRSQRWIQAIPAMALWAVFGCTDGQGGHSSPTVAQELRGLLISRVGSTRALQVPGDNDDLPRPSGDEFEITEVKRYLGKQLFFDPVLADDIRTEFGGDLSTAQSASCGSCHIGEAAGKAGQVFNFGGGAHGRGFTDGVGQFHVRREPIPGLVDQIPTALEVRDGNGNITHSGRFDAIDSVPRLSPSLIGLAFSNRLLLGGKAGEDPNFPGANNPDSLPALENQIEIALAAHRSQQKGAEAVAAIPAYVRLFRDAFPELSNDADIAQDMSILINDRTIALAMGAYLRAVVTRETPWDAFLDGDDLAMTEQQFRGAYAFFAPVSFGGANCVACHSGPMLDKTLGDEDGLLVEANFHNVGIGDHPLQDLARQAFNDPTRRDLGRGEITGNAIDNFKFRTLTLRQLKDGRHFMHNASFTSVRDVVDYFNAGVPQSADALAAGNVSTLFTRPRGANTAAGLGLADSVVVAIVDFLENGLYDPAFAEFDTGSATDSFELNERDLNYSVFYPNLSILGAVDGRTLSGLPRGADDPLTRRDLGLEFASVGGQLSESLISSDIGAPWRVDIVRLTNTSSDPVHTHLIIAVDGLPASMTLSDAEGTTDSQPSAGLPYVRVYLDGGKLNPGQSYDLRLAFLTSDASFDLQGLSYDLSFLSGQGDP